MGLRLKARVHIIGALKMVKRSRPAVVETKTVHQDQVVIEIESGRKTDQAVIITVTTTPMLIHIIDHPVTTIMIANTKTAHENKSEKKKDPNPHQSSTPTTRNAKPVIVNVYSKKRSGLRDWLDW